MFKPTRIAALIFALVSTLSFASCGDNQPNESPQSELPVVSNSESDFSSDFIEVNREGEISTIPVEVVRGHAGDYTIAYDPEYFTFYAGEDVDTFSYDAWNADQRVYYCVYRNSDLTPQQLADGLMLQQSSDSVECTSEHTTVGAYDAIAVYCQSSDPDGNYPMNFFIIEGSSGCYIIEMQFSAEMYGGLYSIMRECLGTFTMIENE